MAEPIFSPEKIKNPEQAVELREMSSAEMVEPSRDQIPRVTPTVPHKVVSESSVSLKSPELLEIEGILSEGLENTYMSLAPSKRAAFRATGEQTADAINRLITSGKANFKKIQSLIFKWLRLLPGVNKFFLEQESKIKTDKILATRR